MLGNGELEPDEDDRLLEDELLLDDELLLEEELLDEVDRDELLLLLGLDDELDELEEDEVDGIEDEEELDWLCCCSSQALTARPSTTARASERSFIGLLVLLTALLIEAGMTASVFSNRNLGYARPSAVTGQHPLPLVPAQALNPA